MNRVVISQRLSRVEARQETWDALDCRWGQILSRYGLLPIPLSNLVLDQRAYIAELRPDAVLLTGGDDIGSSPERDGLEYSLLQYAARNTLPVVGICRGLQMINVQLGGKLTEVDGHVGSQHIVEGPLYPNTQLVNSYHRLGIFAENLAGELQISAKANDGTVEAVSHRRLPWLGLMWHPERAPEQHASDLARLCAHLGK